MCVCVCVCVCIFIYIYIYMYTQSRFIIVRSLFKKLICDIEHVNKIKYNYVEKVKSNIASQTQSRCTIFRSCENKIRLKPT